MNAHKSQSGFGLVPVIIVLLVVGVIGFVGWRLYDMSQAAREDASYGPSSQESVNQTEDESDMTIPDGFKTYESKDIGVAFAYPEAWGDVVLNPGPETSHLVNGSEYELKFSGTKAVFAGVRSSDWEHDQAKGHDGGFSASGSIPPDYDEYLKNISAVTYVNDENSLLVSTAFGGIGCNAVGELLLHKLTGNATYQDIAFLYLDKIYDPESSTFDKETGQWSNGDPTAICNEATYKNYISAEHAAELKKVNATIKVVK